MRRIPRVLALALALALLCALTAPAAFAEYKIGDRASDVLRAKKTLKTAGYYSAALNTRFDAPLRDALLVFQSVNSLDETGRLDDVTLKRLQTGAYIPYAQYEQKLMDQALRPGGKGKYVVAVQARLSALKYLSGKPGGTYDEKTVSAVKLFQRYNALAQTGVADKATRDKLMSKRALTKSQYEASLVKSLKRGDKGEAVKSLQTQLIGRGFFAGQASGAFDKATAQAVAEFQTANGLKASGVANKETRTMLNAGKGIDKRTYEASLQTKPLKPKDKGEAVKVLQKRLIELGYIEKSAGGKYDEATKKAVAKFQKYNKLPADGVASAETRRVMNLSGAVKVADVEGPKAIKKGSSGEQVKLAQARLKTLGFFAGAVNGKYQSDTERAARDFQEANALAKTGMLSGADQILLHSDKALSKAAYEEQLRQKRVESVIKLAMEQLDKPYVWATSGPKSFDCTGLTRYCYASVGIKLQRSARDQGTKDGKKIVNLKDVRRGDILIFDTIENGPDNLSDHAGIYLGNGQFIHASSAAEKVILSNCASGYYNRAFSWGLNVW